MGIIHNIALFFGYAFLILICIGVLWSIFYWIRHFCKMIGIYITTNFSKIKNNGYTYKIEYKYLNYDCFMFDAFKDWFYVIRRKSSCESQIEYLKSSNLKSNCPDKFGIDKDNYGYDICKYKTFNEAKNVLDNWLVTNKEIV